MAADFTPANDEVFVTDTAVVSGTPLSAGCFFRMDADPSLNDYNLFQLQDKDVTSHYFRFGIGEEGDGTQTKLVAGTNDDVTFAVAQSSINVTQSQIQHGLAVWTSATSRAIYLDGSNKGTDTNSSTPANMDRTSIGREMDSSPGDSWDGMIAEFAVWNVALTDAEALILAAGYSPQFVRPGSLVAYWPLFNGAVNAVDVVGGLTLTNTNTVVKTAHPRMIYPYSSSVVRNVAAVAAGTPAAEIMAAIVPASQPLLIPTGVVSY